MYELIALFGASGAYLLGLYAFWSRIAKMADGPERPVVPSTAPKTVVRVSVDQNLSSHWPVVWYYQLMEINGAHVLSIRAGRSRSSKPDEEYLSELAFSELVEQGHIPEGIWFDQ